MLKKLSRKHTVLFIASLGIIFMNISVKAMSEEEILNNLNTVKTCRNVGAQQMYCELINEYGGQQYLCSYHNESKIDELNRKLEEIRKRKEKNSKK